VADPENVAHIRSYLEQHKATYDREALRAKLLADGHDAIAVDQALAEVYGAANQPPRPVSRNTLLLTVLVVIGTVLLNSGICIVSLRSTGVLGGLVPLLLGFALEAVAAIVLWRRRPAVARGFVWGIGVSVLIVAGLFAFVIIALSGL
jgi:hypothetical protein